MDVLSYLSCYRDAADYSVGLYCRLSADDGSEGDSSSIQTQKYMLSKWCRDQGLKAHDIYVDDGFSGLNFNRPDFKRLITDIESHKVNMVVTKDLSRLGRDYIQTGYYTEVYFPEKSVRYVAINDGVDTLKADNDIAPFKNILNDMYAKDLSRKVKSAKRQRALQGMYISSQAPFGYKPNPEDKSKLIVDEEAAITVREIFRLASLGLGTKRIREELIERRFLTPAAHKAKMGDTRFSRYYELRGENWEYDWCWSTVLAILRNRVYVGDMENRKYESINYKTKKRIRVPVDKHIVVENTHEPIVSRELFNVTQRLISARHTPPRHNYENLFKSIIFCMECGGRMTLAAKDIKTYGGVIRRTYYRCMKHYNAPEKCLHHNVIYYDDLLDIITENLKGLFALMKDDDKLAGLIQRRSNAGAEAEHINAEKQRIVKRLDVLSKITKKMYEDFAVDLIEAANYNALMKDYYNEQKSLTAKLAELNKVDLSEESFCNDLQKLKKYVSLYMDEGSLTNEMINQLIERIEVSHVSADNGEKQREVRVVYRFVGRIE